MAMGKDLGVLQPVTAVAVAEPVILKSTSKTPAKPKGWKKWKRRLSHVFTGKKKSKTKKTPPKANALSRAPEPLEASRRRKVHNPSDGSADESPMSSEKGGDRVASRQWERSQERWSGESPSVSEPTDEEWEAEQQRLADRNHDEEEYVEYDDEAELEAPDDNDYGLTEHEDADVRSGGEQEQDELMEDVYEYADGELEEPWTEYQQEETGDQEEYSEEYTPENEEEIEGEDYSVSGIELAVDTLQDTNTDTDAVGDEYALGTPGDESQIEDDDEAEVELEESVGHSYTLEDTGATPEDEIDADRTEEMNEDNAQSQEEDEQEDIECCTAPERVLGEQTSIPQSIPAHMTLLHVIIQWCSDPDTPITIETRLLMASVEHSKWSLAQLVAEKLHRESRCSTCGDSSTETLLDTILTHCTA